MVFIVGTGVMSCIEANIGDFEWQPSKWDPPLAPAGGSRIRFYMGVEVGAIVAVDVGVGPDNQACWCYLLLRVLWH